MNTALRIERASVVYLEGTPFVTRALSCVTLEIEPGEIIGLVGSTGSGKSTLVQAMNGLVPLSEGEIQYPDGYEKERLFERIGLVFQQPEDQLFERTVAEDVGFGPVQLGLSGEEVRRRVERALAAVGLDAAMYADRNPLELSGGEKRRVAIAGILSMEPDFLVLDEPTAGLDRMGRDLLLQSIKSLHDDRNVTLMLISHDMEMLAELAHRLVVLNGGEMICEGTPSEVFFDRKALAASGLRPPAPVQLVHSLADAGISVDTRAFDPLDVADAVVAALAGNGGTGRSGRGGGRRASRGRRRRSGKRRSTGK